MDDIVFPQSVIEAYTGADSWVPAGRIAAATGFKVVALYSAGVTNYDENFIHMGVRIPDGRILDINGIHENDDFIDFYKETKELEIYDVPDENAYFWLIDPRRVTKPIPYPLTKVIRFMFEKYVPSLQYRLKTL